MPRVPKRGVVTKKSDMHDWEGRLYFRNELIDKDARLAENRSKRWIIAYVDPDQTELQKDLEPHISRYDNGKFFMDAMEDGDVKKAFHIEGDQLENRIDIVDEIQEIIIGKPGGKPFRFVVTEKVSFHSYGKLYFRNELIDKSAYLLPDAMLILAFVNSDKAELQKDLEPYISQYSDERFFRPVVGRRDVKEFHIEEKQFVDNVDIVDELGEIKVNPPNSYVEGRKYLVKLNFIKKFVPAKLVKSHEALGETWLDFLFDDGVGRSVRKDYADNGYVKPFVEPSSTNEIKIGKPRRFSPGEKVLNFKTPLIISSDPEKYYTEEYADPSYLVNNPKTGERFYINQDWIKKLPQDMDEIKVNKPVLLKFIIAIKSASTLVAYFTTSLCPIVISSSRSGEVVLYFIACSTSSCEEQF
jgi:hypothetical protein